MPCITFNHTPLEGNFLDTSLGPDLSLDEIIRQMRLGERHGFEVAELQSFGRPIAARDWQRYACLPEADAIRGLLS